MTERPDHDRRLARLGDLITDYEAKFGEISENEMVEQVLQDRDAAALLRNPV